MELAKDQFGIRTTTMLPVNHASYLVLCSLQPVAYLRGVGPLGNAPTKDLLTPIDVVSKSAEQGLVGYLILRKISKSVAIRCPILRL